MEKYKIIKCPDGGLDYPSSIIRDNIYLKGSIIDIALNDKNQDIIFYHILLIYVKV